MPVEHSEKRLNKTEQEPANRNIQSRSGVSILRGRDATPSIATKIILGGREFVKKILLPLFVSLLALPAFGQANQGELQLKVTDPSGLAVRAVVRIVSEGNH